MLSQPLANEKLGTPTLADHSQFLATEKSYRPLTTEEFIALPQPLATEIPEATLTCLPQPLATKEFRAATLADHAQPLTTEKSCHTLRTEKPIADILATPSVSPQPLGTDNTAEATLMDIPQPLATEKFRAATLVDLAQPLTTQKSS